MIACPGLLAWQDTGTGGPMRGMWAASDGGLYVAAGTGVFKSFGGSFTRIGTIDAGTAPVNFNDNGQELALVDGKKGYRVPFSTGTFAQITDPDFPNGATHLDFLIGYFIAGKPNTQTFYISSLYNGAAWDPLDFTSAEQSPDNILAHKVVNSELVVIGDRSTEFYFITNDADFPFQRNQSAFQEFGIRAPNTLQKLGSTLIWMTQTKDGDDMVAALSGYQSQRISTHMIEKRIRDNADRAAATAWTYERDGHHFYALQLPDDPYTLVYDLDSQRWHERAAWISGEWEQYPALCHAQFAGLNLVGGNDGVVYALDDDTHAYGSNPRRWLRKFRPDYGGGKRVFYSQLRLDMETGVGLLNGDGSDPKVMMRYSDDGGNVWSASLWRSAGKIGEYRRRVQWNQLGTAYDRLFELSSAEPVKTVLTSAYIEASLGR
ncbi:MAG TPA: packaged DNA stabilization protein [Nitrospiraceae bacterium]